jgi:molybdopterin-guanine dinucleotide biosynthesis protein A
MKAVILAGGLGQRSGLAYNKCLFTVDNKSLLLRNIESVAPWVSETIVVAGHFVDQIQQALQGQTVTLVESTQGPVAAVAVGLGRAQDDAILCFGDELAVDADWPRLIQEFYNQGAVAALGYCARTWATADHIHRTFSMETRGSLITDIVEKPQRLPNTMQGTGYSILSKDLVIDTALAHVPAVFQSQIDQEKRVIAVEFCKEFFNCNYPDDLARLVNYINVDCQIAVEDE